MIYLKHDMYFYKCRTLCVSKSTSNCRKLELRRRIADARNLQTDSGSHQFAHVCQQLSAVQYYGASKKILPPWNSFGSQELLPANVSSLAETLHGGRLSSPVVPAFPNHLNLSCRRLCWSTTKDSVRCKLNAWQMRRFRCPCSRMMNFFK
jgi:hypothetical protein